MKKLILLVCLLLLANTLLAQQNIVKGKVIDTLTRDPIEAAVITDGKTNNKASWLFANMNINLARPRYLDSLKGHNYVPLAPTLTSTAGLDFRLKNGINGGISYDTCTIGQRTVNII